jgi:hypothetical protein
MLAAQRSSTRRVTGASLWITGTAVAARYPTGHCVIATSHTFSPIFFLVALTQCEIYRSF